MKINWKIFYLCKRCGENVGFLGKILFGGYLHECKASKKNKKI